MEFTVCNRRFTTQQTLLFLNYADMVGPVEVSQSPHSRDGFIERIVRNQTGCGEYVWERLCGHGGPPSRSMFASRCRRHLARTNCRSLSDRYALCGMHECFGLIFDRHLTSTSVSVLVKRWLTLYADCIYTSTSIQVSNDTPAAMRQFEWLICISSHCLYGLPIQTPHRSVEERWPAFYTETGKYAGIGV